MSWNDFKTNRKTLEFVERAIRDKRLGHAYLITGGSSTKLDVARHIAAALNCQAKQGHGGDACGTCQSCTKIFEDRHPDVRIVRPESKARQIRIEDVRELERASFLKASEAAVKVGILVDADRLTTVAQDAFLKTLEEPPKNTIFLLLTSEPQQLKFTILSRCLRINLFQEETPQPKAREKRIREVLTGWKAHPARPPAEGAGGSSGSTLFQTYQLADALQTALTEARAEVETAVEAQYEGRGYENLEGEQIKKIEAEKDAAVAAGYRRERSQVVRVLQEYFRDLAVESPENPDFIKAYEALERMNDRLNRNINEGLALEVALLELTEGAAGSPKR